MKNAEARAEPAQTNLKFPLSIEAFEKSQDRQWHIGRAIFQECGASPAPGQKDGSRATIEALRTEIIQVFGRCDETVNTLARWRTVAEKFPEEIFRKYQRYPWSFLESAGSPEKLEEAINWHPQGTKIDRKAIRTARQIIDAHNQEEQRRRDLERAREAELLATQVYNSDASKKNDKALGAATKEVKRLEKLVITPSSQTPSLVKKATKLVDEFWSFVEEIGDKKETLVDDDRERLIRELTRARDEATAGLKALEREVSAEVE